LNRTETVTEDWIASRVGWSPFTGMALKGWPVGTMIRGEKVMWENQLVTPETGQPIRFDI
jgi:dihydroorotase